MYDKAQTAGGYGVGDEQRASLRQLSNSMDGSPLKAPPPHNGRSELAGALDAQEKVAYVLVETVKALADKLGPVLSPSPASNDTEASAPAYGSSVANCIQTNTIRMHAATEMLQRLMHDLAV